MNAFTHKIVYRLVYNRKNRLNAKDEALVQIEALHYGRRCYFSTHIYLRPAQWNERKQRVVHHPLAKELNWKLKEQLLEIERMEMTLWRQGFQVTLKQLREAIRKPKAPHSFLDFFQSELQIADIRLSTRVNHESTWQLLKAFRPAVRFHEVTLEYLQSFESFLVSRHYHTNTIAKHMKHLKRYVNLAVKRRFIAVADNPFHEFQIKVTATHHSYLSPEELSVLEQLRLKPLPEEMRHTLDAFLFCCYTGLRYSDFCSLTAQSVVHRGDEWWLCYRSVKTSVEVRSPLRLLFDGKAMLILAEYVGHEEAFFRLKNNSNANKQLSLLARQAGLKKHISFHTARHTHATLLLYSGVNITTVQRLLGHRSVRTTQIYAEVMDRTIVQDLERHGMPQLPR